MLSCTMQFIANDGRLEDGETCVFVDAERIANHGRQNDLSPYWIKKGATTKHETRDNAIVYGCLLRIEAAVSNRKISGMRYLIRRNPLTRKAKIQGKP